MSRNLRTVTFLTKIKVHKAKHKQKNSIQSFTAFPNSGIRL